MSISLQTAIGRAATLAKLDDIAQRLEAKLSLFGGRYLEESGAAHYTGSVPIQAVQERAFAIIEKLRLSGNPAQWSLEDQTHRPLLRQCINDFYAADDTNRASCGFITKVALFFRHFVETILNWGSVSWREKWVDGARNPLARIPVDIPVVASGDPFALDETPEPLPPSTGILKECVDVLSELRPRNPSLRDDPFEDKSCC